MKRLCVCFSSGITLLALILTGCSSAPKKQTPVKPVTAKSAPITTTKKSADVEPEPGPTVTCVYGSTKREISVVTKGETCAVNYTKDGNANEIATGLTTSSKCKDVQKTVRGNLEKAGYTCQ